jgi:hypothetical protein
VPVFNSVRGTLGPQSLAAARFIKGTVSNPGLSATDIYSSGITTNGVYYLKPTGAPAAFQAYVDFTTPNGPWVNVLTAFTNNSAGQLLAYPSTWYSKTDNAGDYTNPNATTTSFNAGAFIYCKGNSIMAKDGINGASGYTQCSGFSNESFRDVYSAAMTARGGTLTAWPPQPGYARILSITSKTVSNTSLLYGGNYTTAGVWDSFMVYGFDGGGDNYCMLATASYGSGTGAPLGSNNWQAECDWGFGANELGPADQSGVSGLPNGTNLRVEANQSWDFGTNDQGAYAPTHTWYNKPFSLWIKN